MSFERIRENPVLRLLYRLPFAERLYHFVLALAAAIYFGFPSRRLKVIGITGTKGKTSVVEILAAILAASGEKVAMLSSASIRLGGDIEKNRLGNSMPGRGYIQKFLRRAVLAGAGYAVLEVTSQGVVLSRHRFIRFAAAGITNIHPEHIEAHGSFENYRAAKYSFLKHAAGQDAQIFVNREDEPSRWFLKELGQRASAFDTSNLPELPPAISEVLPGKFNRENLALAVAIARSLGISDAGILKGLADFGGIAGRAEFVQKEPFKVVVDYAHTPESLRAIYSTVRDLAPGKMICVLGSCGGGRDKWKRPAMGEVAAEMCDEIILTNEDPYDEDPEEIIREIAAGTKFARHPVARILDRGEAIKEAVSRAKQGDAVVVTGKGSEPFLHLAHGEKIEWSDRAAAEEALRTGI